ncbi:hypothetical protein ACIPSA_31195 [Streptomyces sp. NPDC086549]|uniref:hypothetical protein n=1 Tax=Streptomyces sp. NPDC086549 TaxID=3365752 RepID=UPI00382B6505
MAAMHHVRRILLVTVTSIAALIGAGSAFAATGTNGLTPDPSGARVTHNSYVRSVFGNTGSHAMYYYNVGG